jgi:hypothetical protein
MSGTTGGVIFGTRTTGGTTFFRTDGTEHGVALRISIYRYRLGEGPLDSDTSPEQPRKPLLDWLGRPKLVPKGTAAGGRKGTVTSGTGAPSRVARRHRHRWQKMPGFGFVKAPPRVAGHRIADGYKAPRQVPFRGYPRHEKWKGRGLAPRPQRLFGVDGYISSDIICSPSICW